MAVTPAVSPTTSTAVSASVVVPLPSWPTLVPTPALHGPAAGQRAGVSTAGRDGRHAGAQADDVLRGQRTRRSCRCRADRNRSSPSTSRPRRWSARRCERRRRKWQSRRRSARLRPPRSAQSSWCRCRAGRTRSSPSTSRPRRWSARRCDSRRPKWPSRRQSARRRPPRSAQSVVVPLPSWPRSLLAPALHGPAAGQGAGVSAAGGNGRHAGSQPDDVHRGQRSPSSCRCRAGR